MDDNGASAVLACHDKQSYYLGCVDFPPGYLSWLLDYEVAKLLFSAFEVGGSCDYAGKERPLMSMFFNELLGLHDLEVVLSP